VINTWADVLNVAGLGMEVMRAQRYNFGSLTWPLQKPPVAFITLSTVIEGSTLAPKPCFHSSPLTRGGPF